MARPEPYILSCDAHLLSVLHLLAFEKDPTGIPIAVISDFSYERGWASVPVYCLDHYPQVLSGDAKHYVIDGPSGVGLRCAQCGRFLRPELGGHDRKHSLDHLGGHSHKNKL